MASPREATVETLWDRNGETPYQTRTKCGPFRIHFFWRGDRDADMHDHPADFWTFPLVSYVEAWDCRGTVGLRVVRAFRIYRRKAEMAHRLLGRWTGERFDSGKPFPAWDSNEPVVTLVWWGKKRREWGFHTPRGWVPWRVYTNTPEAP